MSTSPDLFLQEAVASSFSYSGVLRHLGLRISGTSMRYLKHRIRDLNLSTSHFDRRRMRHTGKKPIESYLVLKTNRDLGITSNKLKQRLWEEGLLQESCSSCGLLNLWNGKPLTLQLDHINGNHADNRLENLRVLCPNCHSQTETHSGKNRKKVAKKPRPCPVCSSPCSGRNKFCSQPCAIKDRWTNPHRRTLAKRPSKETLAEYLAKTPRRKVARVISQDFGVSYQSAKRWLIHFSLWEKS